MFRAHPVLRRRRFFQGRRIRGSSVKDLTWYGPDGAEMTDSEWHAGGVHTIGLRMAGDAIDEPGEHGKRILDDTLLLILNADDQEHLFRLPNKARNGWHLVFDTSRPKAESEEAMPGGSEYRLASRSTVLLRHPRP